MLLIRAIPPIELEAAAVDRLRISDKWVQNVPPLSARGSYYSVTDRVCHIQQKRGISAKVWLWLDGQGRDHITGDS